VDRERLYREALEAIYDDARHRFDGSLADGTPIKAGYCRWCDAPPPDGVHDHDIACPAAKAGYALEKPGYRDWISAVDAIRQAAARHKLPE
jgi:hypothetical protein